MGFFDFLKKKDKEDLPQSSRVYLMDKGRITDGVIFESETTEDGDKIVRYHYSIQGVDFESTEILTEQQQQHSINYAPGASVGVRFDPKNHHNSILI